MKDRGVVYKNIFLMLAYAIDELEIDHKYVDKLKLESEIEVYIELLDVLLKRLINMGVHCEYTRHDIITDKVKGKLNVNRTIASCGIGRNKYTCTINKMTTKTIYNSIIYYTLDKYMRNTKLSGYMMYFQEQYLINIEDILDISMEMAPYYYRPVLKICQMIVKSESYCNLINRKYCDYSLSYNELRMYIIFEKFIRNFIKNTFKEYKVGRTTLDTKSINLGKMITDCTIECTEKTLIVDTKYYSTLGGNIRTFSSNIRHQIRDYLYTYNENCGKNIANGLIIFAKTAQMDVEDDIYMEGKCEKIGTGDRGYIRYKILDLSEDFSILKSKIINNICEAM